MWLLLCLRKNPPSPPQENVDIYIYMYICVWGEIRRECKRKRWRTINRGRDKEEQIDRSARGIHIGRGWDMYT